jgi:hypothetical protein
MTTAAEALSAAVAKVTNRIADPKMQMSKKRLLISDYLTRTRADYDSGHSPATEGAECRLFHSSSRPMPRNRTRVPASAIPYDRFVQMNTEWIDSCQVVHMSALRAGDRFHHGATSYHLLILTVPLRHPDRKGCAKKIVTRQKWELSDSPLVFRMGGGGAVR